MARLPFNPDLIQPPDEPALPARRGGDRPLSVSELAGMIRRALGDHLPAKVRVVGEVSNFSSRTHWFFSLKDGAAAIRCVCFASAARRVGFPVKDGIEVVATGRVDFFDQQGNVQLYVDRIEPVGVGELELRFRALCDELKKLGYFDPARKKPLPTMPKRVAVITSRTGAALQDVINTARQRWAGCQLLLHDVRVQGAAAAPEIAAAINRLGKQGPALGIDAIILTRGGGSIEDLWAFNERNVADAIFNCPLPIAAAIGHETDTTIAEFVADVRCATPTQAAMHVVPDAAALAHQVDQLSRRLQRNVAQRIEHARHRLDALARRPIFQRPDQLYAPLRERVQRLGERLRIAVVPQTVRAREHVDMLAQRLHPALLRSLRVRRDRLDALSRQLDAVGPMKVLQRGYTVTLGPDGKAMRSAKEADAGDAITTVLADGRVRSTVDDADTRAAPRPKAPASSPPRKKVRKVRKKKRRDEDPTLF